MFDRVGGNAAVGGRSRWTRRARAQVTSHEDGFDPEHEALLADSVGLALIVVLDRTGASQEVRGAAAVADTFSGRARAASPALVNGAAGLVRAPGGAPRVVFGFTIRQGKVVEIVMIADPDRPGELDLTILDG
jgi:RNA polymerase sigma-70 factor (ECF subfamily)